MKRLTPKQRKLARLRVKYPTATLSELGLKSGYAYHQGVKRALETPHVQAHITKIMDSDKDLQAPALLETLKRGLKANKSDNADHAIRHRYLDTAFKLRGDLQQEVVQQQSVSLPAIQAIAAAILSLKQEGILSRPPIETTVQREENEEERPA